MRYLPSICLITLSLTSFCTAYPFKPRHAPYAGPDARIDTRLIHSEDSIDGFDMVIDRVSNPKHGSMKARATMRRRFNEDVEKQHATVTIKIFSPRASSRAVKDQEEDLSLATWPGHEHNIPGPAHVVRSYKPPKRSVNACARDLPPDEEINTMHERSINYTRDITSEAQDYSSQSDEYEYEHEHEHEQHDHLKRDPAALSIADWIRTHKHDDGTVSTRSANPEPEPFNPHGTESDLLARREEIEGADAGDEGRFDKRKHMGCALFAGIWGCD